MATRTSDLNHTCRPPCLASVVQSIAYMEREVKARGFEAQGYQGYDVMFFSREPTPCNPYSSYAMNAVLDRLFTNENYVGKDVIVSSELDYMPNKNTKKLHLYDELDVEDAPKIATSIWAFNWSTRKAWVLVNEGLDEFRMNFQITKEIAHSLMLFVNAVIAPRNVGSGLFSQCHYLPREPVNAIPWGDFWPSMRYLVHQYEGRGPVYTLEDEQIDDEDERRRYINTRHEAAGYVYAILASLGLGNLEHLIDFAEKRPNKKKIDEKSIEIDEKSIEFAKEIKVPAFKIREVLRCASHYKAAIEIWRELQNH